MPLPVAATLAAAATAALTFTAVASNSLTTTPITSSSLIAITADMPVHADDWRHQMVQWRIELVSRFRLWRGL